MQKRNFHKYMNVAVGEEGEGVEKIPLFPPPPSTVPLYADPKILWGCIGFLLVAMIPLYTIAIIAYIRIDKLGPVSFNLISASLVPDDTQMRIVPDETSLYYVQCTNLTATYTNADNGTFVVHNKKTYALASTCASLDPNEQCKVSVCTANRTCAIIKEPGAQCSADADCFSNPMFGASYRCELSNCSCVISRAPFFCTNSSDCAQDPLNPCASFVCNTTSGQCANQLADGANCSSSDQCAQENGSPFSQCDLNTCTCYQVQTNNTALYQEVVLNITGGFNTNTTNATFTKSGRIVTLQLSLTEWTNQSALIIPLSGFPSEFYPQHATVSYALSGPMFWIFRSPPIGYTQGIARYSGSNLIIEEYPPSTKCSFQTCSASPLLTYIGPP